MDRTSCPNLTKNEQKCPCPKTDCGNHGICCDCLTAHLDRNTVPSCVRKRATEQQAFRDYLRGLAG
ncbi:MAG: hypothetical protein A3K19_00020 [Lentisphaerae bacterium RIFOXYB12_FULL_65_16]|nr:MAG: hypothetical protein A3K19_00020 [Lentisphaerae bacterium RIFOXYB12_FULL_65_16]